jgi:group II intron reverse transcriptase/maturase
MKERMQKTLTNVIDLPQRDRTESEWYEGVQTFMWMTEDNIVEVTFDKEHLLESILDPKNLNRAYKAVMRNKGCGGIDKMSCEQLLPWLLANKDSLIRSLQDGTYRPNPVRRVEIPKDNGKKRLLGIPTVVDRLVQQAINQVLTPIYERQFSRTSFGFRPKKGCHDALREAQKIVNEGYRYVVDLDLERFFDTVCHSRLIEILSRTLKDGRVVSLIHKYLRSGVINHGVFETSKEGTPQGGPLSPLLSNIMLNELDKELERRGLLFVRYADDAMIFCKSKRAAGRVRDSITEYIENMLHLKVNKEKTKASNVNGVKFLGYTFSAIGGYKLAAHPKSKAKMKSKLKELTSRSNGWGYEVRKRKLTEYVRGWIGYYHLASLKTFLSKTDEWLRHRIRMCIWKAWKRPKTRMGNLIKCGIDAYEAHRVSYSKWRGYWRITGTPILHMAISNANLKKKGYPCLLDSYLEWHPK